jgi:hypothetical protein
VVSYLQVFHQKFCTHFSFPLRDTCLARFILLALIILIISGKDYKLWSSSLCNFLQPPVTSSLVGPSSLLSTVFSYILNLCSVNVQKFKIKNKCNIISPQLFSNFCFCKKLLRIGMKTVMMF